MPFANAVLNGAAMIAVWVTISGFGAMIGNSAAILLRRSDEERSRWAGYGAAAGSAVGLLAMVVAIATVTKL
jgi:hypothetical protein